MDAMEKEHDKKLEEIAREQDQKFDQILAMLSMAPQRVRGVVCKRVPSHVALTGRLIIATHSVLRDSKSLISDSPV